MYGKATKNGVQVKHPLGKGPKKKQIEIRNLSSFVGHA